MKKLLCILCALAALFGLAACAAPEPEPEPEPEPVPVVHDLSGRWAAELDVSEALTNAVSGSGEMFSYLKIEGVTIDLTMEFTGAGSGSVVMTYVLPDESVDRIREAFFSAARAYLDERGEEYTEAALAEVLSASINELTGGFTRESEGSYEAADFRLTVTPAPGGDPLIYSISLLTDTAMTLVPDSEGASPIDLTRVY